MSLSFAMIDTTVTRLLERADLASAQALLAEGAFPDDIWRSVLEAGLPLLLCPAESGGIGGSMEDAAEVARLSGGGGLPAPVVETMIGNWLLGLAGQEPGERPVAPLIDAATPLPTRADLEARKAARWQAIPWARHAELLIIAAGADGLCVGLVPAGKYVPRTDSNLADEPRDMVDLSSLDPSSIVWHGLPGEITRDAILSRMALLRAALMTGAMEHALQMSIEYTAQRNQFGRPLAAFQAIQHALAVLATQVAATRSAVMVAAAEPDSDRAVFLAAVAKARAGDAAGIAAAAAHQVHGAMGFTQEYGLGLATKRLWSWRSEDGSETYWCEWLGQRAREAGDLWKVIAA